jgi:hypothetical protein
MFKISSFEAELVESMEKHLVSNQVENIHGFNKLAKAVDYLHAAASIFEKAGMHVEAEEITEVLQSLAAQIANKT